VGQGKARLRELRPGMRAGMAAMLAAGGLRWLLAVALAAALVAPGASQPVTKMNTTWLYPTPGCRAERPGEAPCYPNCPMPANARCDKAEVCKPNYIKAKFGEIVEWTMAAGNPTPPDAVVIIRSGGEPRDAGKSCCGFAPVLSEDIWTVTTPNPPTNPQGILAPHVVNWNWPTGPLGLSDFQDEKRVAGGPHVVPAGSIVTKNLDLVNLNITWVKFVWNVTKQVDSAIAVTPLYNISYDARYGYSLMDGTQRLSNNSACKKNLFFRICSTPFFEATPRDSTRPLMGAPSPASLVITPNELCGLSVHTPCVRTPGYLDGAKAVFEVGMFDASGANHGVRVGEEVSVDFTLTTLDYGGKVEMQTVDDPGIPIGAHLTDDRPCGALKTCRTLTWTPRKGQEGKFHDAHIVGRSFTTLPKEVNPCDEVYTRETLFRIKVMTPVSKWLLPTADVGQFDGDLKAWPGNAVVGTEFAVTLQCQSNYMPRVDMDPAGTAARFDLVTTEEAGMGERIRTYEFGYTPVRGDEGSIKTWTFSCGDDQDVETRSVIKVAVKTKLCSYTVAEGETLSTMTRRYHLSTNWLNVWNANPMLLTDPDLDLAAGAHVRIGPVYAVKLGDTLATIAAQFSTTVKKLISVNPHLTPNTPQNVELESDTRLCVIACTSHPSPTYSYKWAY